MGFCEIAVYTAPGVHEADAWWKPSIGLPVLATRINVVSRDTMQGG